MTVLPARLACRGLCRRVSSRTCALGVCVALTLALLQFAVPSPPAAARLVGTLGGYRTGGNSTQGLPRALPHQQETTNLSLSRLFFPSHAGRKAGKVSLPQTRSCPNSSQPFLPCGWRADAIPPTPNHRASLRCTSTSADVVFLKAPSLSTPPTSLSANDTACLKRVIRSSCHDVNSRVPRLAHYVWFGKRNMTFYFFVSMLSVARFLRPCLILMHGDGVPGGALWPALLQLLPTIVHVPMERPLNIYGQDINVVEHSADVARLRILLEYGGVYVDVDQFLLRPVDDLLTNPVTIGTEVPGFKCGNGLLFSEPGAVFLWMWLWKYKNFDDTVWDYHSTIVPYLLSQDHPEVVTVVDSFFRPDYTNIQPLYTDDSYDWTGHYGLHLYVRMYERFFGTRLDKQDSTIGEVTRYILYGSKDACVEDSAKEFSIIGTRAKL